MTLWQYSSGFSRLAPLALRPILLDVLGRGFSRFSNSPIARDLVQIGSCHVDSRLKGTGPKSGLRLTRLTQRAALLNRSATHQRHLGESRLDGCRNSARVSPALPAPSG